MVDHSVKSGCFFHKHTGKDKWYLLSTCDNALTIMGSGWLCGTVLGSWPKVCEFVPGSRELVGERGNVLSFTLT